MKRRSLVIALCLVMVLASSLIVYAYFTDYEDAKGGAILHLGGRTETEEQFDGNNKIVKIKNTGDTDMVVRLLVYGDERFMTVESGDSWTAGGGAYYYNKILKPGEETPELKVSVTGPVNPDDPINFEITVVHESARVTYTQDGSGNNIVAAPQGWTGFPVISE